jgi:alkylation response protein AidB-like acyl-CoA dehydrogenase
MAVSTLDGSRSGALLDVVRDVDTEIWAYRDEIERDRRLPSALVNTLVRADMFKLLVPLALGGLEVDILTALRVFEQLAMVDGSAGWAVMIGNSGLFTAWLELEAGREMIGTEPGAPMGGVLDTVAGDNAERLYARLGWTRVGVIPGYALFPDGRPCDTTVFWKAV